MIYATPTVTDADRVVLDRIEKLRAKLRFYLREPRRWYGSLRRATLARAVQGSNSIEGYHASVEDVVAIVEGEEPLHADEETRHAIEGYRAMFDLYPPDESTTQIDLRLYLRHEGRALTETWLYQWNPPPASERKLY